MSAVDIIAGLFAGEGTRDYLGEEVSVAAHMRQAGGLAEAAGAPDAQVAAALLHDVGHICGGRASGRELMAGTDNVAGAVVRRWRCGVGTRRPRTLRLPARTSSTSGPCWPA